MGIRIPISTGAEWRLALQEARQRLDAAEGWAKGRSDQELTDALTNIIFISNLTADGEGTVSSTGIIKS
jgi:hypothetical protein